LRIRSSLGAGAILSSFSSSENRQAGQMIFSGKLFSLAFENLSPGREYVKIVAIETGPRVAGQRSIVREKMLCDIVPVQHAEGSIAGSMMVLPASA